MARRVFSTQIVDSDAFLDMSATAQNLYFHLGMRADDDGFVDNPKKIVRMCGGNEDDLKLLVIKRFILSFESGIIVIKHWLIHNTIRKDRYKKTKYLEEKKTLKIKPNKAYTEVTKFGMTSGLPDGNQMAAQVKLSKAKLSQDKLILTDNKKVVGNNIENLVDYFVELTGNTERKERHCRAAADVLNLCDNSLEVAKEQINKTMNWAQGEGLEWSLELVAKKYLEIK